MSIGFLYTLLYLSPNIFTLSLLSPVVGFLYLSVLKIDYITVTKKHVQCSYNSEFDKKVVILGICLRYTSQPRDTSFSSLGL